MPRGPNRFGDPIVSRDSDRDALTAALGALNRRDRSVAELTAWLADRGYAPADVEAAISELVEIGGLDDERYARLFAEDKRELAGWGPERIASALGERGIEAALIEGVCAVEDRDQQIDRAVDLLATRMSSLRDDRDRNRALGFLTRRGYDYEIAHEAIRAHERAC